MSITIKRPTTAEVQGAHETEDGTTIGPMTAALEARISELKTTLADGSTITLLRDWEGTAFALIDGDARFTGLCLLDDGRVGYGGVNLPVLHPTIAAYLEDDGRAC